MAPPEVMGQPEDKLRVALGLEAFVLQDAVITTDKFNKLASSKAAELGTDFTLFGVKSAVALTNAFDVGLNIATRGNPELLTQVQLLGEPRSKTQARNLAWSLFGKFGAAKETDSESLMNSGTGVTTAFYKIDKTEFQGTLGTTFGFRPDRLFLLYTGVLLSRHVFSGVHEVGVSVKRSQDFGGAILTRGAIIGVLMSPGGATDAAPEPESVLKPSSRFFLNLEAVWAITESDISRHYGWFPGLSGTLDF